MVQHDTTSRRLLELFEVSRHDAGRAVDTQAKQVHAAFPEIEWLESDLAWGNPRVRDLWASPSLTLYHDNKFDRYVVRAFDEAGLNSRNPLHWRLLMYLFSIAHFGPKRGRGPRRFWST